MVSPDTDDSPIIDTRAHSHYRRFHDATEAVLARARAAGVDRVVLIGTDADSTRLAFGLTQTGTVILGRCINKGPW
jgi:Tat protein secretion system quality control protein TatD with DNase activity